jgi:flagellar biosynthesis chaperone FliJ
MTRRFRLAGVLRARQAQEDAAKAGALRARADAETAAEGVRRRKRALADRPVPDSVQAAAYVAVLSARQAMAGELAAATRMSEDAVDAVQDRVTDLTDAAVRRRTMERLAERHAVTRRKAEDRAGQQPLDELASARRPPRDGVGRGAGR